MKLFIYFLAKKLNNFLKSIDTITTKLLLLVLCVITIPIMVINSFSTDIINQSMSESSEMQIKLNKDIFIQKYNSEKSKLKLITQGIIEQIQENRNNKNLFEVYKKNYELDFCALITRKNDYSLDFSELGSLKNNENSFTSALNKIINISFSGEAVLSTESDNNDIYLISAMPVYQGLNKIYGVLLVGRSVKKMPIINEIKDLTNASVVIYKKLQGTASVVSSNSYQLPPGLSVSFGDYFDGTNLYDPQEINSVVPLLNYFNEPAAYTYIGIPKSEFVVPVDRNIQSIGIIAVISLIVAIIIAGIFARSITNPILGLAEAAESIALGDLDYKVKIRGNDEMAQLASSFNQMSNNLKKQEYLRDNFVATLTHDLKVPMLAENQTVTYLLKGAYGEITDEQREVLELIRSTNNSSLEMIGTLLEVYRYDSGNVRLFESEFDVVELLKDSVNQIKSLADDKKIQINIETNRDEAYIKADKREIKRVLHNLISNAINHGIHRGFINCTIELVEERRVYNPISELDKYTSLTRDINLSNCVFISVEDNGIGLAREDMPILFQRFSLGKGRKPAGAGLGLYYSYQVIVQHNGNIWAESSDKGGTAFKFTLPVKIS